MNNASKLWVQKTLNQAMIARAAAAIQSTGRALPCRVTAVNGATVTVSFQTNNAGYVLPRITIPKAESNWIRNPTQIGDAGITVPADTHIGIISGLGATIPNMANKPGNLSALVFMPVSDSRSPPPDPDAALVSGPNGAIIKTTTGTASSVVTNQSGTVVTFGTVTITVDASGVTINSGGQPINLIGTGTPKGIVQGDCVCAFTGAPHAMISTFVKGTL